MWDPKIDKSLARFDHEVIPSSPPENLPLLDEFQRKFPNAKSFAGIDVLFIQHHLGPFIPKLKAMFENGLDPKRCWFIDIPYSTNTVVLSCLKKMGCREEQTTRIFADPLEDYSSSQGWRVAFLLRKLAQRRRPQPLLVVDDGAYFVRYLTSVRKFQPDLLQEFTATRIVEQTTRGHRYLTGTGAEILKLCKLPVVSIARCHTKLNFEAPFIGAAVSRALTRAIGDGRLMAMKRIGVIGYGPVGRATVTALLKKSKRACIDIIDIDRKARRAARGAGPNCQAFSELQEEGTYDMVVGCTGYNSFKLEQRRLLAHEALLASGSSAAVEFNRTGFIELADQFPEDEIEVLDRERTKAEGIHATIKIQQEGGKVFSFLNAGFPVNFDGKMECLPTRMIQSTHCLLYAAACQVLRTKAPGLRPIQKNTDAWIYAHALHHI